MSSLRSRIRARGSIAGLIEPCQPKEVRRPPPGPDWLHEIKYDGYRLMPRRDAGGVRLITRNGHDWAARYPLIVEAVDHLRCRSCLIDGEVVAVGDDGLPTFNLLRSRQHDRSAFLYAFDLLQLDGADLRRQPIEQRKAALGKLLRGAHGGLQLCEHIADPDGELVFAHACAMGLEGIVSKRRGSPYESGPSNYWLKSKSPDSAAVRREAEEDWNK